MWRTEVDENSQCHLYKLLKSNWGMEGYLRLLKPKLRSAMCKFRMRSHHLPVNANRFKATNGTGTICPLCDSNAVGDEYHYVFVCKHLEKEREKFLPGKYAKNTCPDLSLFCQLFSENDRIIVENLARFCKLIMKLFKKEKPLVLSPLKVRKTHVMASGRVSKRPGYLDDYFV